MPDESFSNVALTQAAPGVRRLVSHPETGNMR